MYLVNVAGMRVAIAGLQNTGAAIKATLACIENVWPE